MKIQYDGNGEIMENQPFSMLAPDGVDENNPPVQTQIRLGNQNLSVEIRDGKSTVVDRSQPIRFNTADFANPQQGSILSTAHNLYGPTTTITDETIVDIGGAQTSAKVAANMGYLKRNQDGSYEEISYNQKKALGIDLSGVPKPESGDSEDSTEVNPPPPSSEVEAVLMDKKTEEAIEELYQKSWRFPIRSSCNLYDQKPR